MNVVFDVEQEEIIHHSCVGVCRIENSVPRDAKRRSSDGVVFILPSHL